MKKVSYIFLIFILFVAFLGIYQLNPPAATSESASLSEFSTARAMKHLEVIAQKPHPMGSPEHAKVRDYLLQELTALDLNPQVQKTTVVNPREDAPIEAGTVQNIVVRLAGIAANPKAVLLVAHYDSVPNSPGASDDGVAVAAILETLRALKVGTSLNNDVIVLLSDGEEVGLLGAQAFVDEHPWAKAVGTVLNFEARGNRGPSLLFETSNHNGRLIREFAQAAPHPIASSLFYSIYKVLPNDTDLTVFKAAGLPGLNFAFIDGLIRYHTQQDNLVNVSDLSLQHHGETMLALARRLGNSDLSQSQEPDAIYFNLGPMFIHYSGQWIIPLGLLIVLLFIGVVGIGLRQKQLTISGLFVGFGLLFLNLASAVIAVTLVWRVVTTVHSSYRWIPQGDTYNSHLYMLSFVALSLAIASAYYGRFQNRENLWNLAIGAMFWWLILMVATSLLLPGASYLFAWPLFFGLMGQGILFLDRTQKIGAIQRIAILLTCAIPTVLILAPTIYLIFIALTISSSEVAVALIVLLTGLLIPHLALIAIPNRWLLPSLSFCVSLMMLLSGSFTAGFDAKNPKPSSLFYGLNSDTGKAIWASADPETDPWTSQFLGSNATSGKLDRYLPAISRTFLYSAAPGLSLPSSKVETLSDTNRKGLRTVSLRITSSRSAWRIWLASDSKTTILASEVNGKKIDVNANVSSSKQNKLWTLNYYAIPQEGIIISLTFKTPQLLTLKATDQSIGLPEIKGKAINPCPSNRMPTAFGYGLSDSTLVSKSFTISEKLNHNLK